jgi:hypothetical protein
MGGRELFAISDLNLKGIWFGNHDIYAWLAKREPIETLAHSIYVYDITDDAEAHFELAQVSRGTLAAIRPVGAGEGAGDCAMIDLSIVIPAFNEARRLPAHLRQVRDYCAELAGPCEVIVVDDGSTDGTGGAISDFRFRISDCGGREGSGGIDYEWFGSAHSAGCYFAMCDGSVQLVSYDIDAEMHRRLGNRHDGLVVDIEASGR